MVYGHQADYQTDQDSGALKWVRVGAQLNLQLVGSSEPQDRQGLLGGHWEVEAYDRQNAKGELRFELDLQNARAGLGHLRV